jgi:hypothetical protein
VLKLLPGRQSHSRTLASCASIRWSARQDFDAAARLSGAINQETGSQESKMTRNETAGLATIARMGWETFTVRMLQQATGLSYHQVRRILQGYARLVREWNKGEGVR